MTIQDIIDGKYGISHGLFSVLFIAIGTGIGYLVAAIGGAFLGNFFMAGFSFGGYLMREIAQGHSFDPRKWSTDGQLDALVPALVVALNFVAILYLWSLVL